MNAAVHYEPDSQWIYNVGTQLKLIVDVSTQMLIFHLLS